MQRSMAERKSMDDNQYYYQVMMMMILSDGNQIIGHGHFWSLWMKVKIKKKHVQLFNVKIKLIIITMRSRSETILIINCRDEENPDLDPDPDPDCDFLRRTSWRGREEAEGRWFFLSRRSWRRNLPQGCWWWSSSFVPLLWLPSWSSIHVIVILWGW